MTNVSPLPPNQQPVNSSPVPTPQELVGTIVRSVLIILSTLGVGWSTHFLMTATAAASINIIAGAIVELVSAIGIIGTPIWSYLHAYWMQQRLHQAAEMSAARGRPVMPP